MFTTHAARIILWMRSTNERRSYNVTSSLIGWEYSQNDPCFISHIAANDTVLLQVNIQL